MYLEGQGARGRHTADAGYAMAALLVSLGVLAVLMSAALPVWRQQAQREKEAELIFRGEQYARAIGLYQRKLGPGNYPPNIDALVQQRFLRKKYKDPMVEDGEFQIIPFGGAPQPGIGGQPGRQSGPGQMQSPLQSPPRGGFGSTPSRGGFGGTPAIGAAIGGGAGPIMGVVSKSKEASIRIYKGGSHYNQWQFIGIVPQQQPGGRGQQQPGVMPGGRGRGATPGSGPTGGPGRGVGGERGRGGPGRGFPDPGRGFPFPGPGRGGRGR